MADFYFLFLCNFQVDLTPTGVPRRVAKAIPKYLQPKQYLETDIDSVVPALSSAHATLDPRSPNVPCTRTPIMVSRIFILTPERQTRKKVPIPKIQRY